MDPTVRDILAFHRVDHAAYDRLLSLGIGRQVARDAVALLLWLYRTVGVDSSASVCLLVRTPADAAGLISDAHAVLHRSAWPQCHETLFSSICGGGGQSAVTFDASRLLELMRDVDAARRGVADVLSGVGALVFDDRLHALLRRYEDGGGGGPLPSELAAPYGRRSNASPSMRLRTREEVDAAVRSLFVTFSKGSPLTREEIDEYFTERWGQDCVERVMVERRTTAGDEAPTYGRVVFRRADVAEAVLGGRRLVKLVVNGRHMWARKYVPRVPSCCTNQQPLISSNDTATTYVRTKLE